jgi:hypothetical protein
MDMHMHMHRDKGRSRDERQGNRAQGASVCKGKKGDLKKKKKLWGIRLREFFFFCFLGGAGSLARLTRRVVRRLRFFFFCFLGARKGGREC